ncbi:MAG: type 1 glutamine amidotransferase [Actinobacteria bacterium]|nr:type 1 glutamine amidotransferase [Actinomycetota bacterium]
MRALFLQHDHVSPPGPVADAFAAHGFEIVEQVVVPGENFETPNVTFNHPNPTDFDVLVPMGSPWGAWDDACIGNWLTPELEWLRTAQAADVPIFGICFGGQALARALGGSVAPGPKAEIGWHVIQSDDPEFIPHGPWFQWHYDRWQLPPGATEIARSAVASQAYVIGRSLGLQFHPEVLSGTLETWLATDGKPALIADGQDPDTLIAMCKAFDADAAQRAHNLVDQFLSRVARITAVK